MEAKKYILEQLEYQKQLNEITYKIHSAEDTDDILLNLQGRMLELFDADRMTLYAVDHSKNRILSKYKTGEEIKEIAVSIDSQSISGYCAFSGRIVNVRNVNNRKEIRQIHPDLRFDDKWDTLTGYKTIQTLAAPIVHNKRLQGVIQLINKKDGKKFTAEDESSIQDLAKVLGAAFVKNHKASERATCARFDSLVHQNVIGSNEMSLVMARARKNAQSVESVLMSDFQVPKADIGRSLAEFYQTPFIPFDENMDIQENLIKRFKPGFLKRNAIFPIAFSGDTFIVTMANPASLPTRDAVKRSIRAGKYRYCVSLEEDVHQMIRRFTDLQGSNCTSKNKTIEDILGRLESDDLKDVAIESMDEDDSAIVQLVNKMVTDAFRQGASDIHIEPGPENKPAVIRMRIDGACRVYQVVPHNYKRALVSRIKIMSDLDIAERRLPQDGKIKFKRYAPLDIELRVAIIPTAGSNEDVVMRILQPGAPNSLDVIGMRQQDYHAFTDMMTKPYGLVLVVGPTGSGKTTTLHSAMGYINQPQTKIWTAEDPVEITQDGLRQLQVHPKIGLSFASAMRAFLRADPDVIMVGEMRDPETMSMGIEASLTGHLVLSTLHTNSAPETLTRLLDMGMDPYSFSDALLGVLAQRLARTLCKHCKEAYSPSRKYVDGLARLYGSGFESAGFAYKEDLMLCRPKGCPKCNQTGYLGRTAIFELLKGTDAIKALIQKQAPIEALRKQAILKDGMTTLMQDGIRKVFDGLTDIHQVRQVCIK